MKGPTVELFCLFLIRLFLRHLWWNSATACALSASLNQHWVKRRAPLIIFVIAICCWTEPSAIISDGLLPVSLNCLLFWCVLPLYCTTDQLVFGWSQLSIFYICCARETHPGHQQLVRVSTHLQPEQHFKDSWMPFPYTLYRFKTTLLLLVTLVLSNQLLEFVKCSGVSDIDLNWLASFLCNHLVYIGTARSDPSLQCWCPTRIYSWPSII